MTRDDASDPASDATGSGLRRRHVLRGVAAAGGAVGVVGLAAGDGAPGQAAEGCDLEITKSQDGPFDYGGTGSYTVEVCNVGSQNCVEPATVIDELPDGVSYEGGSGTGWLIPDSASGGEVSFAHPNGSGLAPDDCLPPLTIDVSIAPESEFPGGQVENYVFLNSYEDVDLGNNEDREPFCTEDCG